MNKIENIINRNPEVVEILDWDKITKTIDLNQRVILKHAQYIELYYLTKFQILSQDTIMWIAKDLYHFRDDILKQKYQEELNTIKNIIPVNRLQEEDTEINIRTLYWRNICTYQHFSEKFMKKFKNSMEWDIISKHQILSEDFIREFKDKLNWHHICRYQTLSEDFIREFKDIYIDWYMVSRYQNYSNKFIFEFAERINPIKGKLKPLSWDLYKSNKRILKVK